MLDILSVDSSVLTPHDIQRIQDGFAERIQCLLPIPAKPHRLEPCDLTITYDGDRQAVFVREGDAHDEHCDCPVCTHIRELLDGPIQELTPKNIWGPTTRILPFDESGDRRIFLAHIAHSLHDHINTDPLPKRPTSQENEICLSLENGREIDLETGRVRRNVTPKNAIPIGFL